MAISADGRLLASSGLDGSLVVFDLAENRVVSRVIAHRGAVLSVAWSQDVIFTSGVDGLLRQWSLTGAGLQLRDQVQEVASVRLIKAFTGGWAYGVDGGILSISRAGSAPLRLELAEPIRAIDVSPDMRYVAASVAGEIAVVDLRDDKLATLSIDTPNGVDISFADGSSLALMSSTGLKIVGLNNMYYEQF
jgi:WD40 repeat protein